MKTFSIGGIHPAPHKHISTTEIKDIIPVGQITLMLSQHIGAPAKPVVKQGDKVEAGQMVAEADGFVSAPVHTPFAGTVKKIEKVRDAQGRWADAIIIDPDLTAEAQRVYEKTWKSENTDDMTLDSNSAEHIYDLMRSCGIVGLGGATFPTQVKFSPASDKRFDLMIVNGAECEPWLMCDDALMQHKGHEIIAGLRFMMKVARVGTAIIGIEANKPKAIAAMREAAANTPGITVVELKTKYPQGGEKQLIEALTGRQVPEGGLPADVGVVVDNVATVYAMYEAVCFGRPLTHRLVTVTGPEVKASANFLVPIGVTIRQLIDAVGGMPEGTGKILAGGPMMGRAVVNIDAPVTKGLSGLVLLPEKESRRPQPKACIRCAACVTVCPMGLEPYRLERLVTYADTADVAAAGAMSCIECGSCQYTCPSGRPLLDIIRLGKQHVNAARRAAKK